MLGHGDQAAESRRAGGAGAELVRFRACLSLIQPASEFRQRHACWF